MQILIQKESIIEAKKRIGDDPFIFKNDFLKIIKDESPDFLLWLANYSKIKFGDDSVSNNWFSFAAALIFALFDFEIYMFKNLENHLITKEKIENAYKSFKDWNGIKKYYEDLNQKEPFLFDFSEQLRDVAKKIQSSDREKVKHEDVVMIGICYVYRIFEMSYSK